MDFHKKIRLLLKNAIFSQKKQLSHVIEKSCHFNRICYKFVRKIQTQNHPPVNLPRQLAGKSKKEKNHRVEWMIFLPYYSNGRKLKR